MQRCLQINRPNAFVHIKVLGIVFLAIILSDFCCRLAQGSCVFDKIRHNDPPQKFVSYEHDNQVTDEDFGPCGPDSCEDVPLDRKKRSPPSALYDYIRISVHYASNLDMELPDKKDRDRLKRIVDEAVDRIQQILSVIPVTKNLTLARSVGACHSVLGTGINKGKCSQVKQSYLSQGETCIDNFRIPEQHLEGLYVWNLTHTEPIRVVRSPGPGLPETDYILYVQSRMLGQCLSTTSSVIAYATYCQLDQNNRPIAGYTNFCPKHVKKNGFNDERLIQVAVHELFHALGFSSKLFDKFKDCSKSSTGVGCPSYSRTVASVLGFQRIVTPNVVRRASHHFNCTTSAINNQYGVPLQVDSSSGKYTSHWDARFMRGSIMVPNLGLAHLTVIDAMTLAVFEDTGWYKVSYNRSRRLVWGKDGGCQFGSKGYCSNDGDYFCTGNNTGCHILHLDKAQCSSDGFTGSCKFYWAKPGGECFKASNFAKYANASRFHGEYYGKSGRCFISNATIINGANKQVGTPVGRCYETRCNETDLLEIRVGAKSPWVLCPASQTITVPGFEGQIDCPAQGILCRRADPVPTTTTLAPTTRPPRPRTTPKPDTETINCKLTFKSMDFSVLSTEDKRTSFLNKVYDRVVGITRVSRHRLKDGQVVEGSVIVGFVLMPSDDVSVESPSSDIYNVLVEYVKAGNFSITFDGKTYTATGLEQVDFFDFDDDSGLSVAGMIVGIVVGSLVAITLIVLAVIMINKVKASRVQGGTNGDFHAMETRNRDRATRGNRGTTNAYNASVA